MSQFSILALQPISLPTCRHYLGDLKLKMPTLGNPSVIWPDVSWKYVPFGEGMSSFRLLAF